MKLIFALVVLAGYVQNNGAINWQLGQGGEPSRLGIDVQLPLPRVGANINWGGVGGNINANTVITIDALNKMIQGAESLQLTAVVDVLRGCRQAGQAGTLRLGEVILKLRATGQLDGRFTQWVLRETGIDLTISIEVGPVDTKKVAQQAINSVKKLLKLAQGILVSVLKQLADFLKQYLPQIADTLVSLLNAALPPYIDALVGCTQPILDLVGMLIAECPKDPEVENSTTGGSTPGGPKGPSGPRPGGPSGPGGPELPPFPVGGGPPTPVISSVQETDTPAGPGGDPQP